MAVALLWRSGKDNITKKVMFSTSSEVAVRAFQL